MTQHRVLVVGATGRMGTRIVRELTALGAEVRTTQRADLADEAALVRACEGIDVVVSALQGGRDVIVDGQTRLFRAAEQAGVARMIPSDYSVDFFKTIEGQNRNLNLRRELDRALDASKVRGTSVLCGAFMDLLAMGAMGPDPKTGVYRVWGDPDQPYDFTATDDVARYVAAVALDAGAGRVVRVAGDTLSPRQLAAVFTEVRGVPATIEVAGTLEDLDRAIAGLLAADDGTPQPFPIWQRMQYTRDMASGRGKLAPIDNDRYPSIRPQTVRELLSAR